MEVPEAGWSDGNGTIYLWHSTDWRDPQEDGCQNELLARTLLARSTDDGNSYEYLYDFSREQLACCTGTAGASDCVAKFIQLSVVEVQAGCCADLPTAAQSTNGLVIFGTGNPYRKSPIYLAFQPLTNVATGQQVQYWTGTGWTEPAAAGVHENQAAPIIDDAQAGELSAAYYPAIKQWVLLFRYVSMSASHHPVGPWSTPQAAAHKTDSGAEGVYLHQLTQVASGTGLCDGFVVPNNHNPADNAFTSFWPDNNICTRGGFYGPYQFPQYAALNDDQLTVYFALSTWNPYEVVLMKLLLQQGAVAPSN